MGKTITITLDDKTWAQLCMVAQAGIPAKSPEEWARLFVTQDTILFMQARREGESAVIIDEQACEDANAEVERRMSSA